LADLEEKGQIKKVVGHSKLSIYSTSQILEAEDQLLMGEQLARLQLLNKYLDTGFYDVITALPSKSAAGICGREGHGLGICNGLWELFFGVAYPIELLLNCEVTATRCLPRAIFRILKLSL